MRRRASGKKRLDAEGARERCLRLLGVRARSAGELRERLRSDGFEADVVEGVVEDLRGAGLVDDREFARSWVRDRQASGAAGREKLRWELRRKRVAEDLIREVVDEGIDDEGELRRALEVARRRTRGAGDTKERGRVQRLLLGRGYDRGTVDAVLRRISEEE